MAALVRQGVDRVLAEVPVTEEQVRTEVPLAEDPLWRIIGIADSTYADLAEKHDEYLVKWLAEENASPPERSS
jgi:hypothetical protein